MSQNPRPKQLPSLVASYCFNEDKAKIYPRKVTIVPLFVGKELNGMERLISANSYELIKMNRKECFLMRIIIMA